MTGQLDGKVAFVTGSSRNIGRAIAEELAREGAAVALNAAVSRDELTRTARELRDDGHRVAECLADLGDRAQVARAVAQTESELGPVGILVLNHAVRPVAPLLELSDEDWFAVQDTNLNSAFHLCRAVLPGMVERGEGTIVAIGGGPGQIGRLGGSRPHVLAALAGRAALLRSVMHEFGPAGVRVNFVVPGIMNTTRAHPEWYPDQAGLPQDDPAVLGAIPLRRAGEPVDVAHAVAWLCSEHASYVHGAAIAVSGGWGL